MSNAGGGTLNFTASDDGTWLSVNSDQRHRRPGRHGRGRHAGLAAGTYSANLTVDAGGRPGSPKVVPVTLTVADTPPPGDTTLGGSNQIGTSASSAPVGAGEAYRFTATTTGIAGKLRVYVDSGNAATQLIGGLYADSGGNPARCSHPGRSAG